MQNYEMLFPVDATLDASYYMENNLKRKQLTNMTSAPSLLLTHSPRKAYVLLCSNVRR